MSIPGAGWEGNHQQQNHESSLRKFKFPFQRPEIYPSNTDPGGRGRPLREGIFLSPKNYPER